ncbi:MAG: hypothetical protein ABIZ81_16775 [Opitutaceae bacterium]
MTAPSPAIALVGDYSPEVPAHQAIPRAFELIVAQTGLAFTWHWIGTTEIRDAAEDLSSFSAVWLVPASPYKNMAGALAAIRWARETRRPFLGTCGGFQHALIEIARNVAGLSQADHAETNPCGPTSIVTALVCPLDQPGRVRFVPGSLIAEAYQQTEAVEGYRCSFGVNPKFREALEAAGVRFTAFDGNDSIRSSELGRENHPFFVGTLFQPERAALRDEIPPLAHAFVKAAIFSHEYPPR